MNIKITDKFKKIICIPLVGIVMTTGFTGCTKENVQKETIVSNDYDDKLFAPGEHIISIDIDDPTEEKKQYKSHDGYKVVGISTEAYGRYNYLFGNAHLLYVNEYPVKCKPTAKEGKKLLYTKFGKPVDFEKDQTKEGKNWKEFSAGEHIISVPLSEDVNQMDYYEGYEPIGIATSSYGRYNYLYGGGCVLYTNTEKVKCTKDNDSGKYTSFGVPEEETKTLEK